jgi:hypothetical protein
MTSNIRRRARVYRRRIVERLGSACSRCGETIKHALTIDRALNDGARERRQFPDVRDLYRHILAEGVPRDRYELLCRNCHESKNQDGLCAHEVEARRLLGLAA